jgi:heme oxygenase
MDMRKPIHLTPLARKEIWQHYAGRKLGAQRLAKIEAKLEARKKTGARHYNKN